MRGAKQKVKHAIVVAFAVANERLTQSEIAKHFGLDQSRVCRILRKAGIIREQRGRPLKQRSSQSDEQFRWEQILHDHGLGLDRGMRLNKKRILYGFNPLLEVSR